MMRRLIIRLLRSLRLPALIVLDTSAWLVAMLLAVALRLDDWDIVLLPSMEGSKGHIPLYGVAIVAGAAATVHILLAWLLRLHQGRSRLGGFEEIFVLATIVACVGVIIGALNLMAPQTNVPRTAPVIATVFAFVLAAWPRGLWRVLVTDAKPNRFGVVSEPVLVIGAGDGACQLVDSMLRDPKQHWRPIGFADDDRRKRHFRHRGVKVLGTIDELGRITRQHDHLDTVVVAIPSASSDLLKRVNDLATEAELQVKVLPAVADLLDDDVSYRQMRDIEPADLLGRRPVETDLDSIAGYLTNRKVLVTGAGGSIGSELCRQIARFDPAELMMLDRDESALHALMLSLYGRADLESDSVILANVREADRVHAVMRERRPDVVFHTAALKHVNILEKHPSEAVRTNVLGTLNVLEAAADIQVERFVNISTDKAADPVNVLGYTKRIAEGLTADFANDPHGIYLSVRFGNVLGTSGSVLTTFESQVSNGGPITVTDPEVTRFFMTVNEAVQLVIQAAAIGKSGEALVLDMGEPVSITDVAREFVERADEPIEVVFTGLKAGEKMHEVLFGEGEIDHRPVHPLISHVGVPAISRQKTTALNAGDDRQVRSKLVALTDGMVREVERSWV